VTTDGRQTDGRTFTFAKNEPVFICIILFVCLSEEATFATQQSPEMVCAETTPLMSKPISSPDLMTTADVGDCGKHLKSDGPDTNDSNATSHPLQDTEDEKHKSTFAAESESDTYGKYKKCVSICQSNIPLLLQPVAI